MVKKMPDNNKKNIEVVNFIEEQLQKSVGSVELVQLYYAVMKNYGYGQGFVNRHIKSLEYLDFVKISNNTITWKKPLKTAKEIAEEAEVEFLLKEQKHTPAAGREE
jgi:hypothetical protein